MNYQKYKIFNLTILDCWLFVFPTSSLIKKHTDVCNDYEHHRFNIVLKQPKEGGDFYVNGKKMRKRWFYFRPDLHPHYATAITKGSKCVLSFGFYKRKSK